MRFVLTETGSIYQIDHANKLIRRLEGKNAPTTRVGKDGEWKPFEAIESSFYGDSGLSIVWRIDETEEGPVKRTTQTSPVVYEAVSLEAIYAHV